MAISLNLLRKQQNPLKAVAHHDESAQLVRDPVGPQQVVAQLLGAVRKEEELCGRASLAKPRDEQ